jgi:hypothetical protein
MELCMQNKLDKTLLNSLNFFCLKLKLLIECH